MINQKIHLIILKSALRTGSSLEFHNASTFGTCPLFTVLLHHASDAHGLDPFGTLQGIQIVPFDIFFGVFLKQWAWKLTAASAIAEILFVKAGFNLALQTGLIFTVITNQTACTRILISLATDAVNPAGSQ